MSQKKIFLNLRRRREYIFLTRPVTLSSARGLILRFPCIGMYHDATGVPIAYPRYEQWIMPLNQAEIKADETLRKKALSICNFLNYVLWETTHNKLEEVSLNDIRGWIESYRETSDGNERDPLEWQRGICTVYRFLLSYLDHIFYCDSKIKKTDLFHSTRKKESNCWTEKESPNLFSVKSPRKVARKNRMILSWHLDILLHEAKKHDPMLVLGIALQAYAGLREGEIVNLCWKKLARIAGGYGQIRKISIDLWDEASFSKTYTGKSGFGSIKKYRTQDVYSKFTDKMLDILKNHEGFLMSQGLSMEPDMPIFYDNFGKPMTVNTYKGRLKSLFYCHFVPALKRLSEIQNSWAENGPYIDAYERDYPGAHMLRHWFTMYLLTNTSLKPMEVSKWRGDSSPESMNNYIHVNADLITEYQKSATSYQKSLLKEILNDRDLYCD